jgi:hypothetical protein
VIAHPLLAVMGLLICTYNTASHKEWTNASIIEKEAVRSKLDGKKKKKKNNTSN